MTESVLRTQPLLSDLETARLQFEQWVNMEQSKWGKIAEAGDLERERAQGE